MTHTHAHPVPEIDVAERRERVFFSYSRHDAAEALAISEQLSQHGFSVWIDQHDIGTAERWPVQVVRAIDRADVVLLLVSKHSMASENVMRELAVAGERDKRIVPVMLDDTPISLECLYYVAGLQRVPIGDLDGIVEACTLTSGFQSEKMEVVL